MNEFLFPENEIQKMNEIQNRMMGNLDDLFASPEDFAKVNPPRKLRIRRRKKRN